MVAVRATGRDANFDYIEADSPSAAAAVDRRIRDRVRALLRLPQSGRPGRVDGDTVQILRVLHGSQHWPDELPPR
ncbi:MAG: type II toxin-antitoxin system RelE/ParE family toxin [Acetobacteraceae bacterium]